MIEYPGDKFGDIKELEEVFGDIRKHVADGDPFKALCVGSPEELKKKKTEAEIQARLDVLEAKVKRMEPGYYEGVLYVPTPEELRKILENEHE